METVQHDQNESLNERAVGALASCLMKLNTDDSKAEHPLALFLRESRLKYKEGYLLSKDSSPNDLKPHDFQLMTVLFLTLAGVKGLTVGEKKGMVFHAFGLTRFQKQVRDMFKKENTTLPSALKTLAFPNATTSVEAAPPPTPQQLPNIQQQEQTPHVSDDESDAIDVSHHTSTSSTNEGNNKRATTRQSPLVFSPAGTTAHRSKLPRFKSPNALLGSPNTPSSGDGASPGDTASQITLTPTLRSLQDRLDSVASPETDNILHTAARKILSKLTDKKTGMVELQYLDARQRKRSARAIVAPTPRAGKKVNDPKERKQRARRKVAAVAALLSSTCLDDEERDLVVEVYATEYTNLKITEDINQKCVPMSEAVCVRGPQRMAWFDLPAH